MAIAKGIDKVIRSISPKSLRFSSPKLIRFSRFMFFVSALFIIEYFFERRLLTRSLSQQVVLEVFLFLAIASLRHQYLFAVLCVLSVNVSLYSSGTGIDLHILLLLAAFFTSYRINRAVLVKYRTFSNFFILGLLIYSLSGLRPGNVSKGLSLYLFAIILFLYCLTTYTREYGLDKVLRILFYGGTFGAWVGIAQHYSFLPKLPGAFDVSEITITAFSGGVLNRLSGPIGDYELFGLSLTVTLLLGIELFLNNINRSKFRNFFWLINLSVLLWNIYLAGNRSSIYECFVFIPITILLNQRLRLSTKWITIAFLSLSMLLAFSIIRGNLLFAQRSRTGSGLLGLIQNRISIWNFFISDTQSSLIGNGFRPLYSPAAHNIWITAFHDGGLIGVLGVFIVCISALTASVKLVLSPERGFRILIVLTGCIIADNFIVEPQRTIASLLLWSIFLYLPILAFYQDGSLDSFKLRDTFSSMKGSSSKRDLNFEISRR